MTKRLLLILALSGAAFGQMTWQQCQDNATTELNNCVAAAQKTFDTQKATDLANYNDCIDPNSPRSSALAACYRSCNSSDYPCFNRCYIEFLGITPSSWLEAVLFASRH